MNLASLLLLTVAIAVPRTSDTRSNLSTTKGIAVNDSTVVDYKNDDQGHSTFVLILAVLGGIVLTALFLHCCWCCALYCLIGWRTRTLQKQIVARREKMPRVPFIIMRKDDDSNLDAEIVLNFDRYEVADEKWFAFKKVKTSSIDRQSTMNDSTARTSDPMTN